MAQVTVNGKQYSAQAIAVRENSNVRGWWSLQGARGGSYTLWQYTDGSYSLFASRSFREVSAAPTVEWAA